MTNKQISEALDEIGSLLEIKGESTFRTGAYHRAADVVRDLGEEVTAIYERGELLNIPRIGQSIAAKIGELIVSGKCQYLEHLRTEVPSSLKRLMLIPGVGPRTAKTLYDLLNITSIDELKSAAEKGQLRDIKGFGAKTEENILRSISEMERRTTRMRLDEAYSIAQPIVEELRKHPAVMSCEAAGSLRRMKETIGDIDILAASNKAKEVMDHFVNLPMVEYVIAKGETKSSVLASTGLPVDLRVISPKQWGAALQYFTGSKEHSVHLRGLARAKKAKISEYGVFDENNKMVAGTTEEGVYEYLGMPYIPPFLREDKGEIEAALEGRLPKLVSLKDIKGDLHTHSKHSDGLTSIEEMAETAISLGYEYIGMTDHAEKLYIAGGLTVEEIGKRQKEIDALNERFGGRFMILSGLEVNIDNDGNVDYEANVLKQVDVVVASIHAGFGQSKEQLTKRMLMAIENPNVHIIAHPTGRLIGKRDPYLLDLEKILEAAAKTGTCLEINAFPDRLDLRDEHVRWAIEKGVTISVNTDAHYTKHLQYMKYGVATAQRGWAEKKNILNTLPLKKLLSFLKK